MSRVFPAQRSFDDLGTPLSEVTFCVLDLETTGGSAQTCQITEVGAVKVRGGEVLGTFQTMVNPGTAIPPRITVLTGISDHHVIRAPPINEVLPSFLEFAGGSVLVGHNLRFDMSFIEMAMRRWGGPMLGNQRLDTLALARRLLVDEVPNFKLGELARRLRLEHQPSHRALDDALATVDLLHLLIERATAWGVTGIDDLVDLPTIAGHPQRQKLALTRELPRSPGVYQFLDAQGTVLYVGKATDLRSRVRSYFSSDRRRKVAQLLRETEQITHQVCRSTLEAEILELRLIQSNQPRFNQRGRRVIRPHFVRLTLGERFPRLSVVRTDSGPGVHLGPVNSRKQAQAVVEAIQSALPIRRCRTRTTKKGPLKTDSACSNAQLGVANCPCSGAMSESEYSQVVHDVLQAMTGKPDLVLSSLDQHMQRLAIEERFEDAATIRDQAAAFVGIATRQRRVDMLDRIDRLVLETSNGVRIELGRGGLMTDLGDPPSGILGRAASPGKAAIQDGTTSLDETLCVASWLDRNATSLRVIATEGTLCLPLPRLPSYQPPPDPQGSSQDISPVKSRQGR